MPASTSAGTSIRVSSLASDPDPFAASTTKRAQSTPKVSNRDVTIPILPELHDPDFLDKLLPAEKGTGAAKERRATASGSGPGSAFMGMLHSGANRQYTQNSAHAYASTLSATLDAFNGLSQATDPADVEPLLRRSWAEDSLLTLKIIFNLRSIHEGKGEKEGFYRAWGWLWRNHPRTAIINLGALVDPLIEVKLKKKKKREDDAVDEDDDIVMVDAKAENESPDAEGVKPRGTSHGFWKDLLNLLVLASEGELDSSTQEFNSLHRERPKWTPKPRRRNRADPQTRDARVAAAEALAKERAKQAQEARDARHKEWRVALAKRLERSPEFKALYIAVARLFSNGLINDFQLLKQVSDPNTGGQERVNTAFQISLCSKWAPSIGGAHDRVTNISSAIAELLWRANVLPIPFDKSHPHGAVTNDKMHDLRSAYTRWILSPLRRFLQLPEIFMSSGRWNELPYKRVASVCMQKNKTHFIKHDEVRFSRYLADVAKGKRTISGATLLPNSLISEALAAASEKDADAELLVIEAQWKTLVDKLRESGTLENSIAVCDVSGSMGSLSYHRQRGGRQSTGADTLPIYPAVALSLVLSQIAKPPWNNCFITFSSTPEIVRLDPTATLVETVKTIQSADWGMNTDYNAVFTKLILPLAVEHGLSKEEMIKRLFVFSDMEFDQSTSTSALWETEHEKVVEAFHAAGYEVPEIVYWNLQGARGAKPVLGDREGVAMMSGFSPNMLKAFMENGAIEDAIDVVETEVEGEDGVVIDKAKKRMTPEDVLKNALGKPSYDTLVVVD